MKKAIEKLNGEEFMGRKMELSEVIYFLISFRHQRVNQKDEDRRNQILEIENDDEDVQFQRVKVARGRDRPRSIRSLI